MPRVLSPTAAQAIVARETEQVFLCLLELSHPDITTIRIANNTEAVVRTDGTFQPYPFEVVLPDDSDAGVAPVQLRVDNIDRSVTRALRNLSGVPRCKLRVVLASNPNVDEIGPFDFRVTDFAYDAMTITATIGPDTDLLNTQVPAQSYVPSTSPGLFV